MFKRRDFLHALPLSLGLLPGLLSRRQAPSFEGIRRPSGQAAGPPLRIALMGLGSYASRVAEAIKDSPRVQLTGLISGTPAKRASWRERFAIPEENIFDYQSFDAIRGHSGIDAVYICTPNALHREQTLRLAAAKKHVICEKPLALHAAEALEMVNACEKAGVKLLVGYRMRFEAKTRAIIRMRQAGEFGKLVFFQALCGFKIGNPGQWRLDPALAGGGALMDIGIYAVNGSRYMLGEDPIWVTAQETKTDPEKFREGVDETIQFQLGFPGGAVASCLSTYNTSHLDRFLLTGHGGFAELHPATGYGPIRGRTHLGELTQDHVTHQLTQLEEMAEIILRDHVPPIPVDGREGWKDMVILDAIYRAARSGQREFLRWD